MLELVFILVVVGAITYAHVSSRRASAKTDAPKVVDINIKCPSCDLSLGMEKMLDAAIFYSPGAIVFDCIHCQDRIYFSPYETHIEVGILGCSPVVDPVPIAEFAYPENASPSCKENDGMLDVQMSGRTWHIPRYGLWNVRADVPKPADSRATKGSGSKLSEPT